MKYRANQLETVSEVARAIATLKDSGELLNQITHLISERFGFYHVGIFLLDENKEYACLRAANSAGGQHMLERGHRLTVGQVGIVGYVTGKGEARIALDVGEDAVFFDNPDLPATRSELALPLKIGERVIGALDVQSTLPNAFREEDISVLGTLADQVAIAIENNRLYSETRSALNELQILHGRYLSQAWTQAAVERRKIGYQIDRGKVMPIETGTIPDGLEALQYSDPILLFSDSGEVSDSSSGEASYSPELVAPIHVRGQMIGLLNLSERETGFEWTDDELSLVKNIVDQIGLALENARLIEQTQRRAEREHLVAEITSKLRSSNDAQEILETARREIQQALKVRKAQIVIPGKTPPAQPDSNTPEIGGNGRLADEFSDIKAELGGVE
jgi:GAF domain-containing protein